MAQDYGEDGQELLKNGTIWAVINSLQSTSAGPSKLITDGVNFAGDEPMDPMIIVD